MAVPKRRICRMRKHFSENHALGERETARRFRSCAGCWFTPGWSEAGAIRLFPSVFEKEVFHVWE